MTHDRPYFDLIIIGGGPAGLFCAANSAGSGLKTLVLEKMPSCGRKLLITGSGQCNLTHEGEVSEFIPHYGKNGRFLRPALMNFTNLHLIEFFREKGITFETDKNGKFFPSTRKATDILSVLLEECENNGVIIRCEEPVKSVGKKDGKFIVDTGFDKYTTECLAVSTGGASYPHTGSSGDGYRIAEMFGHEVVGIAPALTPLYVRNYPFADLSGVSFTDAEFSLYRGKRKVSAHRGDILLTHKGLSGPGILDFSRYAAPGDLLKISFMKGVPVEDLTGRINSGGRKLVKTVLSDYLLPERFVKRIIELSGIHPEMTCAHLPKKSRDLLLRNLLEFPVEVERVGGFKEAMVTRGGVSLEEINPKTMESRIVSGLYFIGEVLDIDGDTGGYNLQAAFSTAFLAAEGIVRHN